MEQMTDVIKRNVSEWLTWITEKNKAVTEKNKAVTETELHLLLILTFYPNLTLANLLQLIEATNVKGAKFVSLKGYNSDKSENTEIADFTVNIGISYENMLNKDSITLNSYDIDTIQTVLKENVMKHNFGKYNLSKFANPNAPHEEILNLLPTALIELKQADQQPTDRKNNNVKLNPVLWFNSETKNLLIFGKKVYKNTIVKGEFKKTASAPLTVAKNIIRDTLRKDDLRTFKIDNILASVTSKGDTLQLS